MTLHIGRERLADYEAVTRLEYLETNGLGGWAASSLGGAHTRRYHGLLVAATDPPVGRTVLLSKLDETVEIGGERHELGCNQYPGTVWPRGHRYLDSVSLDLMPEFAYQLPGARLERRIVGLDGENTTLVHYRLDESSQPVVLELRPFVAGRDYHSVGRAAGRGFGVEPLDSVLRITPWTGGWELFVGAPGADFAAGGDWYYDVEYRVELYRGLEFREDLWTPGVLRRELAPGERFGVLISTADPRGRDAEALLEAECRRRLSARAGLAVDDEHTRLLCRAADQFVVRRGGDLRTVIAGYHWFGDWGRDTMIALPGLTLATGRLADAQKVLRSFARSVSQGMLPNRYTEVGAEPPEYNTVDATLWFFIAVARYLAYGGDADFVESELIPVLREVVEWHDRGTRYGIRVAPDGLLRAGEPGVQLTWMDAKVGDWVVTPREGKAVEINALWYNALRILAELEGRFGRDDLQAVLAERAEVVQRAFERTFWNESSGCLYDVVGDDGTPDASMRPNQIFALSLPFPLLSDERAERVLAEVERRLLTPVGLRSLSADHPDYRPVYGGDALSRDGAYHQGTVWSWLLGPFVTALVRVEGEAGRERGRRILERAFEHLGDACLGSISEIFDAEPPHAPRGAAAQAWSVAELLRAYLEDVHGLAVAPEAARTPAIEQLR